MFFFLGPGGAAFYHYWLEKNISRQNTFWGDAGCSRWIFQNCNVSPSCPSAPLLWASSREWAEWQPSRGTSSSASWWTQTAPCQFCWCPFCSSAQDSWLSCSHKPSRRSSPDVCRQHQPSASAWKEPPAAFCVSFPRGFKTLCLTAVPCLSEEKKKRQLKGFFVLIT